MTEIMVQSRGKGVSFMDEEPREGNVGMVKPVPLASQLLPLIRLALLAALVIGGLWLLGRTLLVLFAGVLLAVLLRSLAHWTSKGLRLSRTWGFVVVFVVLALLVGAAGYLMAPRVAHESAELVKDLQLAVSQLNQMLSKYIPRAGLSIGNLPSASSLTVQIVGATLSVTDALVTATIILFVGFYGAVDPNLYVDGLIRLVPPASRNRAREVVDRIGHTLRWWLLGRLTTMASVGLITFIGLTILGIPLAIALSLLAGMLTFIPYLGAIVAGAPAVLIALIHAPSLILQVILVYVIAYIIEGYIIGPLVQQRATQLPPALMLGSQALLGTLFGLIGIALAAPIAAVVIVVTQMIYLQDILGEKESAAPS